MVFFYFTISLLIILLVTDVSMTGKKNWFHVDTNKTPQIFRSFPYQVSLILDVPKIVPSFHFCSGSIISKYLVITSAHCFYDKLDRLQYVHLEAGVTDKTDRKNVVRRKIKSVNMHSNVTVSYRQNDVAIIEIKKQFAFNKCIQPIKISEEKVKIGTVCKVTGWSSTSQGEPGGSLVCDGKLSGVFKWGFGGLLKGIFTDTSQYIEWIESFGIEIKRNYNDYDEDEDDDDDDEID
ncbi:trypsin II-P29-like isoform X2 [Lycorma delicatula]|uniref:trypsin II-P29-like isoform X2 n=1 Tax=Lycorma delicatula TaxID=130591 RepID=UPI003F5130EE